MHILGQMNAPQYFEILETHDFTLAPFIVPIPWINLKSHIFHTCHKFPRPSLTGTAVISFLNPTLILKTADRTLLVKVLNTP